MEYSGVLSLVDMEAVFEKTVVLDEATTTTTGLQEDSTLSKLGSTISKLFSGGEQSNDDNNNDKKEEKENEQEDDKDDNNNKGSVMKEKQVAVKETLYFTVTYIDIPDLTPDNLHISKKKLEDINTAEINRSERESARNTLESYIMDAQDQLYQQEYEEATTEQERESIRQLCTQLGEWLYEEGFDQAASVYRVRLSELASLFEPVKNRVQQHRDRPEALQASTYLTLILITALTLAGVCDTLGYLREGVLLTGGGRHGVFPGRGVVLGGGRDRQGQGNGFGRPRSHQRNSR
ncbi:hypothetical protein Pcinc_010865 [Petrolisthes cinctipes]|uniref:Hypoxia up-regulated protein 1 n=1 Tax=Petrolisthes cinctipes TaxID=88211 RepID=A0AAE1G3Z1_PETCI|nr:hypothetical protein Pcinc_010865 [Petrolisthes cinctipes]